MYYVHTISSAPVHFVIYGRVQFENFQNITSDHKSKMHKQVHITFYL